MGIQTCVFQTNENGRGVSMLQRLVNHSVYLVDTRMRYKIKCIITHITYIKLYVFYILYNVAHKLHYQPI
jgi:hypothetical protein